MDDAQLAEILKLDVDERLRIELDRRIAEDDADPEDVMSWQQAKEMIKQPRAGRGSQVTS